MEVQVHPMIKTIPRFIQIRLPLSPLKPMVQSRRGVKRTCASPTRFTPHLDWAIGFKGGKGSLSWINLGIDTIGGRTCTSLIRSAPCCN
jgi:hypothetical protein